MYKVNNILSDIIANDTNEHKLVNDLQKSMELRKNKMNILKSTKASRNEEDN